MAESRPQRKGCLAQVSVEFSCYFDLWVQVLILSHENAKALELDPYHSIAFAPVRPKVIFGKNAKLEKVTGGDDHIGREIVGHVYNDVVIRYCSLPCFADDHKFIICEQDHRFWRQDTRIWEFLDLTGMDQVLQGQGIHESLKPLGPLQPPSDHLRDVLACCTMAKRWVSKECPDGHGEFVWLCAEPKLFPKQDHYQWKKKDFGNDRRTWCPGTGNYMHMMTAKGARYIRDNVLVSLVRQNRF